MKTSTKTLNAKIDQQREEIAKLKAEIKESNEHIETLSNKLLDSK